MSYVGNLPSAPNAAPLFCLVAAVLISSALLQATDSIPDRISFDGREYNAWSALHFYDYVQDKEGCVIPNSTGGYHARWRVRDRHLMLEGFDIEVDPKVEQAVKSRPGGIHAQWFSGIIRLLPKGSGITQFAAEEIHLIVRQGVVESYRHIENRKFLEALKAEQRRRGAADVGLLPSLVRKQKVRDWVRSLQPLTRQEMIELVLCRQSELMSAFQAADGDLDGDEVLIAANLPLLIQAGVLQLTLERIGDR